MGYSNANHAPFFYVKKIMMMYKNQAAGGGMKNTESECWLCL